MVDDSGEKLIRRIILGLLLGGLLVLSYAVLHLFIVPVVWASIIAFSTWPLYWRLRKCSPASPGMSALLMTFLITLAFVLPVIWLSLMLRSEVGVAIATVTAHLKQGPLALPEFIRSLPWIGDGLQTMISRLMGDPEAMVEQIGGLARQGGDQLLSVVGGVGRNTAKLFFALLTLFFIFRDGERILQQVQIFLHRFLGARVDQYLEATGSMTTAVVWGIGITAIAQGIVAGIGYWWVGLPAPILLGAMTALIAMIPFGAPLTWGPIGIWLLLGGDTTGGIMLLLWGALVVSIPTSGFQPVYATAAAVGAVLIAAFSAAVAAMLRGRDRFAGRVARVEVEAQGRRCVCAVVHPDRLLADRELIDHDAHRVDLVLGAHVLRPVALELVEDVGDLHAGHEASACHVGRDRDTVRRAVDVDDRDAVDPQVDGEVHAAAESGLGRVQPEQVHHDRVEVAGGLALDAQLAALAVLLFQDRPEARVGRADGGATERRVRCRVIPRHPAVLLVVDVADARHRRGGHPPVLLVEEDLARLVRVRVAGCLGRGCSGDGEGRGCEQGGEPEWCAHQGESVEKGVVMGSPSEGLVPARDRPVPCRRHGRVRKLAGRSVAADARSPVRFAAVRAWRHAWTGPGGIA